jgi:hypothetical protein
MARHVNHMEETSLASELHIFLLFIEYNSLDGYGESDQGTNFYDNGLDGLLT